ncbi:MAG: DUF1501 domain-containing protein [Planctomycetota bacterium]
MPHAPPPHTYQPTSRREMLRHCCAGFGGVALAGLLGEQARAAGAAAPHFAPRAKRVIFLFMHGGPSSVDTFDYKPELQRMDGQPLPVDRPRVTFAKTGVLLKSPFKFRQHGESGAWVSELFPHVAGVVDELCMLKSVHGTNPAHGGALLALHTGSTTFVRPSMGSWVLYGLGSENENLPGFVTICPTLGHGGVNNWSSGFLPAVNQGVPLGKANSPAGDVTLRDLHPALPATRQRQQLDFIRRLNEQQLQATGPDRALEARIQSFELAFRMQTQAPGALDLSQESKATTGRYGLDNKPTAHFARQCLLARRLVERGVRFVQCTHSYKWDQHANLEPVHRKNAMEVDQPIAALIDDLKSRGLLDETLVLWGGEFGRTPTAQNQGSRQKTGRDHNPEGFTMWMAGGGVKPGFSYGATDPWGYYAVEDRMHIHDLHATLLHLLGIDHTRLTYRYAGRDFRLTDVEGVVADKILA